MDEADRATTLNEEIIKQAIQRHANRYQYDGPSAADCTECGDQIPKPRRQAVPGCTLCVSCQREADRSS